MTQCNPDTNGYEKRGRGTGKTPFLSPDRIKSEEGREGDLIGGDSGTEPLAVPRPLSLDDDPAALERYLADNPAMTARDWKGKGFHAFNPFDKHYVHPNELPWDKLDRDEVRRLATSEKARFLTRGQRMAAGRDPGLIWDERTRSYRLKADATPAPATATEAVDGVGGENVTDMQRALPAAATNKNANTDFQVGTRAHAAARPLARGDEK